MRERPAWMKERTDDPLWLVVPILPTDYTHYGGDVERWSDPEGLYPDCSSCCKWFAPLYDEKADSYDCDWGVCTNPKSPRAGLLTWEHQAGHECGFEYERDDEDDGDPGELKEWQDFDPDC